MIEKTDLHNKIAAAVKSACARRDLPTLRAVVAELHGRILRLKRYYTVANGGENRRPVDEWLCDNYYVLEKETKQSVKDIRQLSKKSTAGLARLYAVVDAVLSDCMPPICDETMQLIIKELQKTAPVGEHQFSFIPAAVKTALVGVAYRACMETGSDTEIAYAITGISKLASVDFETIVATCSRVEQILADDPAGVYINMSSESRQYYRHLVSLIARKSNKSEEETAREKLKEAQSAAEPDKRHIGYGIVTDARVTAPKRARGKLVLFLSAALPLLAAGLAAFYTNNVWMVFLCYLPFWEILRTPLWQLALAGTDVDFIPRMELKKIKDKPKTIVLVSTLLPKAAELPAAQKRLEQLYFSNSDPDMYYCILADFKEWDFPTDEKDESQVLAVSKLIEELNARYNNRFMLFLRSRVYNRTQKKYSGWERKRGAITEFIRFLKGEKTSMHTFAGDYSVLSDIKYIIALDSDTNLLYESAQTLVSAAMHPLNRPVASPDGVVARGYGILTPKMSADLNSAKATAFSRVLSGCGGVTAYDTRDKDFYQDLFGESIFAGKGLIDIDSFYTLLSDRFPENHVLSHDILEGAYLRVGFVSDVEMTDCAPSNMTSWLSRLHRWVRGDWQNIQFIAGRYKTGGKTYENPIGTLSKFKLFDNLRRSLTPVASMLCVVAALFAPPREAVILGVAGAAAMMFSSLWAAVWSLLTGGFFTLSRKFFTRTLPHTLELVGQALVFLIMLPAQAISTADAACRSLWRVFVSHKKLLEWTTAAQNDMRKVSVMAVARRYLLPELLGLIYLLLAPHSELSLLGLAFALVMPVAYYSAKPTAEDSHRLSGADRDALISYNAAMWRYYEDFANAENHFLPPDNIQQSPVFRVANRTSPTNIGMMLLSALTARDLDFIDTNGLYARIERTLSSVERLKLWHGNLYNWYDTLTLGTLKPEFVSTVDSGNFICCLVALKEGLREFTAEKPEFRGLIRRIEAIIEAADLTKFYDKRKNLFSIGLDCETGKLVDSHYDFLMSEARLTSYFAVARKTVGKKHWGTLNRTMSRCGSFAGAVSWTGTMFEYYMPHLLLPVYDGSLLGEALTYCLYCHKKRAKAQNVPWGISESAFYAFDNNLNYQYKAHGVGKLGVKRYLDKELVISPYSTFITIPFNPNSSMSNLRRLKTLGVYGRYGFFEAVDFTERRVGTGSLAVTRSYMAHHIGMSMVASCNALFENRMQERFMKDHYMKSANEFLQEKIAKNTVVYDELKHSEGKNEKHERPKIKEETAVIDPRTPRCVLLTNGEITDILTDTGASYLKFGGIDLTRRSEDLLRRAQGFLALVKCGSAIISTTKSPFYDEKTKHSVEYEEHSVSYFGAKSGFEAGMRCLIHPTISCEQRQLVVKNNSGAKKLVQALLYFEPVLCPYCDYNAHPAYSKLFVTAKFDPASKTITYTRRNRDSTQDMFLTVGFLQDIDYTFETNRENLMSAPNGMDDLANCFKKNFSNNGGGVPDACCALKFDLSVAPGAQREATLLLAASRTEAEGIAAIISMRKIGLQEPKNAAVSPVLGDSLEGRLGGNILGQLLFTHAACEENSPEKLKNNLGQSGLWCTGISGDLPIALIELSADFDELTPQSYIRLHASLRRLKVEFDLVILYDDASARERLAALVEKNSVSSILGARGGVFLLEKGTLAPETLTLIRATARHTASKKIPSPPAPSFKPLRFSRVSPAPLPEGLAVYGGVFSQNRFYSARETSLPFCHVLANPQFGTLVSDSALGYTWAVNSRENKLTPWYNDICTDNSGEMCILRDGDVYYDLARGARASFSEKNARYSSEAGRVSCEMTVSVPQKGLVKYVDVSLKNNADKPLTIQLAYYTEPVLGVNRDTARHIRARITDGMIVMNNPYVAAVRCHAALSCKTDAENRAVYLNDRAAFLCGEWGNTSIAPQNDPCAAIVAELELSPKSGALVRFSLACGATERAAVKMAGLDLPHEQTVQNSYRFNTPDKHLNEFLNGFAPHQIVSSRIYGRCAFYQCGGAYGFRDQLQDVSAYLLIDPALARRHIIRCCSAQFEEGDVLHWWHNLPSGKKGVRTRFSDDLLWLPITVAEYVEKTGDASVLDIPVHYLKVDVLEPCEHEKYISPEKSPLREDVFSHCKKALEKGYNLGENGLPLIGCGDWNDGFSSVGLKGKGTSVWLALFLARVLQKFAEICAMRGKNELEAEYLSRAEKLKAAVDEHCWDGEWYLRAFYDNGEKMGGHESSECRIDLLPQSFAVLSGMPDKSRVDTGLESAYSRLVDEKLRLVRLFNKPFEHSRQQPGYVKAYPGGIRENGGQYTHSAVWFAIALLKSGKVNEGYHILEMLNPVNRSAQKQLARQYKLEPYYMAADIYTNPHAPGRGGWSIYTGAVSWYFRAVLEYLLGFKLRGGYAQLYPKLPESWPEAEFSADVSGTRLNIRITRGENSGMLLDGAPADKIPLDGGAHEIVAVV